jgi:hypothetical protein
MVKTEHRIAKLSQRQQISLLPGLAVVFEKTRKLTRVGKKRGPYKTKASRQIKEEVTIQEYNAGNAPHGYFAIEGGELLPNDLYEM